MSDTTIVATSDRSPEEIAEALQPEINAIETVIGTERFTAIEVFVKKYVKGIVAFAGTTANLALFFITDPNDPVAHYANVILGVATIAAVVIAKNTKVVTP